MSTNLRGLVGHNRYILKIDQLDTHLDVLAFEGHDSLSQPYLSSAAAVTSAWMSVASNLAQPGITGSRRRTTTTAARRA